MQQQPHNARAIDAAHRTRMAIHPKHEFVPRHGNNGYDFSKSL
jgi:hypothetical protein